MTIKKGTLPVLFTALLITGNAQAEFIKISSDGTNNDCAVLKIQISNQTNEVCILDNNTLYHGIQITAPPASILAGESKTFNLTQALFGPHIELTYRCGDKKVSFESQQNACRVWPGAVFGNELYNDIGIHTKHDENRGGKIFYHGPGQINWVIFNGI